MNVHQLATGNTLSGTSNGVAFDSGGGGGNDGGMEDVVKRLGAVEQSIARIDATLPSLSTKADLTEATLKLTQWMVGLAVGLGVAAITVGTFVINNATPRAPTQPPPAIIINVPPQGGAPAVPTPMPPAKP